MCVVNICILYFNVHLNSLLVSPLNLELCMVIGTRCEKNEQWSHIMREVHQQFKGFKLLTNYNIAVTFLYYSDSL